MIPLYKPFFPRGSRKYAREAIDSGWVSWVGPYQRRAADKFRELFGHEYVILTSSGTAAVQLMAYVVKWFGVDHIHFPTNCYVGAVNPFLGALDSLQDIRTCRLDKHTWNGSPLGRGKIPQTAVVVHNLGSVVDVPSLYKEGPDLLVVEDCCEALGGEYRGKPVGSEATCAAFSFYASKNITTGEGGAFVCKDEHFYEKAKLWTTHGLGREPYKHTSFGLNFRMSNIQAGLLLGQLEAWDEIFRRKLALMDYYRTRLISVGELQRTAAHTENAAWMFGIRIPGVQGFEHSKRFFDEAGIEIRPFFYPLNEHKHLREVKIEQQSRADKFSKEIILLPSYPELIREDKSKLDYIIEKVKEYAAHNNR
jgi:dTDP-4-amino-4,6-dideoxygalactose transaminase